MSLYTCIMSYNTKVMCDPRLKPFCMVISKLGCMQARNTERFDNFTDYGNGNVLVSQTVLTWLMIS